MTYKNTSGTSFGPYSYTIGPYKTQIIGPYGSQNVLYAAYIQSTSPTTAPFAATVRQYKGSVYQNYNVLAATIDGFSNAPLVMNAYYGWDTSINVQNTSTSWNRVIVEYFDDDGGYILTSAEVNIPPRSVHSFYTPAQSGLPTGYIGSARIYSNDSRPIVVVVNQSYPSGGATTRGKSYSGSTNGSTFAVLPDVLNYYGSEDFVTSVNVQNLGYTESTVWLACDGYSWGVNLPSFSMHSFYVPGFWGTTELRGRAFVTADQPFAVVVNHGSLIYPNADLDRAYEGINR